MMNPYVEKLGEGLADLGRAQAGVMGAGSALRAAKAAAMVAHFNVLLALDDEGLEHQMWRVFNAAGQITSADEFLIALNATVSSLLVPDELTVHETERARRGRLEERAPFPREGWPRLDKDLLERTSDRESPVDRAKLVGVADATEDVWACEDDVKVRDSEVRQAEVRCLRVHLGALVEADRTTLWERLERLWEGASERDRYYDNRKHMWHTSQLVESMNSAFGRGKALPAAT